MAKEQSDNFRLNQHSLGESFYVVDDHVHIKWSGTGYESEHDF